MTTGPSTKTIHEPASEISVCRVADVVVVGGGPAGFSAAIAAARNGVSTILLERYGHLGGLATGGLVMVIMPMSDGTNEQQIAGICQEIIDRLDAVGAAIHPDQRRPRLQRKYAGELLEALCILCGRGKNKIKCHG